jgi:hypothetical protein
MEACVATMSEEFIKHTLIVDNSDLNNNIGCMAAHNLGIEEMRNNDAEWLIILSPVIRFGKPGGMDFVQVLAEHMNHYIIHAASYEVTGGLQHKPEVPNEVNKIKGWHATAFRNSLFDNIGTFDNNFAPYSLDDIDLSLRVQKFYKGMFGWNTYPCDIDDIGPMGHSINLAGVKATYAPRESYFKRKWGRGGADPTMGYEHPFNDPSKPLSYWPESDDELSIWQNEYKSGMIGYTYTGE